MKYFKCKICGKTYKNNTSGNLYRHCQFHNIKVPSNYIRSKYEQNHNSNWFLQYFDLIEYRRNKQKKLYCPYHGCEWSTIDLENTSGCITTHLSTVHGKSPEEAILEFPKTFTKNMWMQYFRDKKKQKFLNEDPGNRILCLACQEEFHKKRFFKKITNTHLDSKHNITANEYKKRYSNNTLVSLATSKIQSVKSKTHNSKMMKYYLENDISMPWHTKEVNIKKAKNNFFEYRNKYLNNIIVITNFDEYYLKNFIEFQCKTCGDIYSCRKGAEPRCYTCEPLLNGTSNGEQELFSFITDTIQINENELENRNRTICEGKEIDILYKKENIGIEYNGLQWHSENGLNKIPRNYHKHKSELALQKNIHLYHIFEDEWKFKSDIIYSKLFLIFNNISSFRKIHGRKTTVDEISSKESMTFLGNNHLQGGYNSSIRLGLYHHSELVSVMTLGKRRKNLGHSITDIQEKDVYELHRFAIKKYTIVHGAFNKLIQYFIKTYNPIKIETYADRRWTPDGNHNVYAYSGFTLIKNTQPNYFYTDYKKRFNRFQFTKHKLVEAGYDPNKTEWEIMQERGFDRIWDCGSWKYELVL